MTTGHSVFNIKVSDSSFSESEAPRSFVSDLNPHESLYSEIPGVSESVLKILGSFVFVSKVLMFPVSEFKTLRSSVSDPKPPTVSRLDPEPPGSFVSTSKISEVSCLDHENSGSFASDPRTLYSSPFFDSLRSVSGRTDFVSTGHPVPDPAGPGEGVSSDFSCPPTARRSIPTPGGSRVRRRRVIGPRLACRRDVPGWTTLP